MKLLLSTGHSGLYLTPSPTKASLYGAILFTLQQTRWLPVSKASLIFVFTMFMVSCKVSHRCL